ncbi:MAG: RusA family crossover junction endodeoxyribonuclease [Chitinophagales bacterium]
MHNFILKSRPLSYNSCRGTKKLNYKSAIEASFLSYNTTHTLLSDDLYATIYYFFNKNLDLDTDNISKPLWDCLNGFLFNDDQQIKIRIAGSFDLTKGDYSVIDLTGLQGKLILDLLDAFENEDHIVYVECGKFKPSMYKFNIE